jgi:membrane-associated phospholipid phosphatase
MVATAPPDGFERRLVARRLYPVVIGAVLAAGAVVTALGVHYTPGSWAERIDRTVDPQLITRFGGHVGLVRGLSDLGSAAPVLLATSALAIAMLALGRLRAALLAVLAPSTATLLTEAVLKPLVGRIQAGQAYPSGHATAFCAVAFAGVVLALDQRPRRLPRLAQVIVCGAALGLVGCVSVALVAAQYHFASDTIGGVGVALATVLTLAILIDGLAYRRVTRRLDNRMGESHHAVG